MAVSLDGHWSTFIALEQVEDEEAAFSVENANPACPVLMLQLFAQVGRPQRAPTVRDFHRGLTWLMTVF